MLKRIHFLLVSLLLMIACNNDGDAACDCNAKSDYSCIKLYDENGQPLGIYGCDQSSDWGAIALTAEEKALLNFSDNIELVGTPATEVTELAVYPNPMRLDGSFNLSPRSINADRVARMKFVVVNESGKVLVQQAVPMGTNAWLAQQISANLFQSGQYYRLYYQVGTDANPALLEGYGNILVCKNAGVVMVGNIETDCK
jgi:hypothetical protein